MRISWPSVDESARISQWRMLKSGGRRGQRGEKWRFGNGSARSSSRDEREREPCTPAEAFPEEYARAQNREREECNSLRTSLEVLLDEVEQRLSDGVRPPSVHQRLLPLHRLINPASHPSRLHRMPSTRALVDEHANLVPVEGEGDSRADLVGMVGGFAVPVDSSPGG